jgi:hypothetical protein
MSGQVDKGTSGQVDKGTRGQGDEGTTDLDGVVHACIVPVDATKSDESLLLTLRCIHP